MSARTERETISAEEYLEGEKLSKIKHEYLNGRVYSMAGASDAHVTLTLTLLRLLWDPVLARGWRAYASDMKVQIQAANVFYYPDILVTCDEEDRSSDFFKRHPILIVEVLSPHSTEEIDRGEKFRNYRLLDSLQEYVLVRTDAVGIECYRKARGGKWEAEFYGSGATIHFASVQLELPVEEIYEHVILKAAGRAPEQLR